MEFVFSDEQRQFREVVQRFIRDTAPISEARRITDTAAGFDQALWLKMNDELGLGGLHHDEAHGGLGFGAVELGIVLEEMGRALVSAPYLGSSVLAAGAIAECADEAQRSRLLPDILNGRTVACLAIAEQSGSWDLADIALGATRSDQQYLLNGTKSYVLDGCRADLIVVAARSADGDAGVSLFTLPGDNPNVARKPLQTLDSTRQLGQLTFTDAPAQLLGALNGSTAGLSEALDLARIALAHEMVGGAQALLDAAVEYAGMRMQFGRVIGSFQAVKHKCADMLLEVELAKSAAYYAAEAYAEGDAEIPALAALAKTLAAEAYMHAAQECIQIHGGIGFTWDQDTHLWYRRAKSSEVLFGDAACHRERYIAHLESQS